jgi:hypothetical protein
MSKWSPSKPVVNSGFSGNNAYFGTMNSGSSSPSPLPTFSQQPPPSSMPPSSSYISSGAGTSSKQSYSMSKWSPSKPTGSSGFSGTNPYFGQMASPTSDGSYGTSYSQQPSPPSYVSDAKSYDAVANQYLTDSSEYAAPETLPMASYADSLSSGKSSGQAPKKSYSPVKWSPKENVY